METIDELRKVEGCIDDLKEAINMAHGNPERETYVIDHFTKCIADKVQEIRDRLIK